MSEAVQGEAQSGGAGAQELAGGGDGGGEGGPAPEWLGTLPEDLRADATLGRYKTVEDLARGHIEAHKVAKSKLVAPGEGATPEQWGSFFDQIGRPSDPAGYDFGLDPLPEDADEGTKAQRDTMVKQYQDLFHPIGLLPHQAAALVKADIDRIAEAQRAHYAKGEEEITALKTELGDQYETKKAAAKALYVKLGLPPEFADELDTKVGSGALMRGFIALAEKTGEHGRIDGEGAGGMGGELANAEEKLRELNRDASWRQRFKSGDAEAVAQEKRLREAAMRQAGARRGN